MATQKQIDDTYNYMDKLIRLAFGDTPDISCALFDGDYSKSLEQAQTDKHTYILDSLNVKPGQRVLDIGCGWGGLLMAIRQRGAQGVGLTLSRTQHRSCRRLGLETKLVDWRETNAATLGGFDAIASVGAFEHFCSEEEYRAGQQDQIYARFFALCSSLLPTNGRLYLQTMTWGNPAPPAMMNMSLNAPKGSNEYILAVVREFYPGSFLPFGAEHIENCSSALFRRISIKDGRRDYIETMQRWARLWQLNPRALMYMAKLVPLYFKSRSFRYKIEALRGGYNRQCFVRQLFGHVRMVLENQPPQ